MKKGKKQMDADERLRIELELALGTSLRATARKLGRSVSTVSREIARHTCESFKGCYGRANQCVHRRECALTCVCGDCPGRGVRCASCGYRNCNRFCDKVEYIDCPARRLRPGKVCFRPACPRRSTQSHLLRRKRDSRQG